MLKVSFKGDFKRVETLNNKTTVVSLTGKCITPFWFNNVPRKIWEWAMWHRSVEISETYKGKNLVMFLEVSGKSVCADNDTFDAKMGERIAECRAKIKLYKFMQSLTTQLCEYYYALVYGNQGEAVSNFLHPNDDSLYATYKRYTGLLDHERHHLNELLQKTV